MKMIQGPPGSSTAEVSTLDPGVGLISNIAHRLVYLHFSSIYMKRVWDSYTCRSLPILAHKHIVHSAANSCQVHANRGAVPMHPIPVFGSQDMMRRKTHARKYSTWSKCQVGNTEEEEKRGKDGELYPSRWSRFRDVFGKREIGLFVPL